MLATALPTPSNTFLPILLETPLASSRPAQPYGIAPVASYSAGAEVVGEGDVAESYYQVISGLFRTVKLRRTDDGRFLRFTVRGI